MKGRRDTDVGLESLICYNLKRAYMVFQDDVREVLGRAGMTARAFSALSPILHSPEITQSEVSRRLGIERSGLVAIVDELQDKGYAVRRAVPDDRRVQALSLTKKGRAACLHAQSLIGEHESRLLADFTLEEQQQLLSLLKRIRKIGRANT